MELIYTDGCICTSLSVDGKEFNIDLTQQERLDIRDRLIEEAKSNRFLTYLYSYYIDMNLDVTDGDFEEYCNRCEEEMDKFEKLTYNKRKDVIRDLNRSLKDDDYFSQHVFIGFMENEGKYENLGHCDCCGDVITQWTYMLE